MMMSGIVQVLAHGAHRYWFTTVRERMQGPARYLWAGRGASGAVRSGVMHAAAEPGGSRPVGAAEPREGSHRGALAAGARVLRRRRVLALKGPGTWCE
jgi:hypothetical protein